MTISTTCFAEEKSQETNYVVLDAATLGLGVDVTFDPGVFKTITNSMYWTVRLNCRIKSHDSTTPMKVRALKGSGTVNGRKVSAGKRAFVFTVHNKENLYISAESGAEVSIQNQGLHAVKAHCSL